MYLALSAFLTFLTSPGCGPLPDIRSISDADIKPPVFLGIAVQSSTELELIFQESVEPIAHQFRVIPTIPLINIDCTDQGVLLNFQHDANPGGRYHVEGVVQDSAGNRLQFITNFYGFNPEPPDIYINEFITRGSSSHPDVVELYVASSGNIAGLCLFEGTADNWSDSFVFPPLPVERGDYIIVHFKPQGIPEEIDEVNSKAESGGLDASPNAWDFWIRHGDGISGNNGVISLYTSPSGELIDGVLYSNRTSDSDEKYRGFGRKDTMLRADQLYEDGGWQIAGTRIAPEDGINPDGSTSTRSMCRPGIFRDTDTKNDWHITPTSGATFGTSNSDEVYINPE